VVGLFAFCEGGLHFRTHPVRHRRDRNRIVPLVLHGDGTPCSGVGKSWWTPWAITRALDVEGYVGSRSVCGPCLRVLVLVYYSRALVLDSCVLRLRVLVL